MACGNDGRYLEDLIAALERQSYVLIRPETGLALLPPPGSTPELIRSGLALMTERGAEFAIYDPLCPSPSDPGAYFSYSPGRGHWRLTLGNHGWSGGIYALDEDVVAAQLVSLHQKEMLTGITLRPVGFFSHYRPESSERNAEMRRLLLELHA